MTSASSTINVNRRPFGLVAIIVIQLLTVLVSGFLLALLVFSFLLAEGTIQLEGADPTSFTRQLSPVDFTPLALTFVVNAVCAVGMWWRQRWAWFLTMMQLGFFMASDLYGYFNGSPPATYVWSMLLNVFMVFYLNQRDVQVIFQNNNEERQPR